MCRVDQLLAAKDASAVDGGDAFVVTTTERARDLPLPPVLVQCAVQGMTRYNEEDQMAGLRDTGQQVTVAASNRILINGRVPVNPHGGALSDGGTQGSGH